MPEPDRHVRHSPPIPDIPPAGLTTIDLGPDDHNHLIRPEDRVNLAMGLQ